RRLEPQGFQGLLSFSKGAKAKHLPLAELEHPASGRLALDSAALPAIVDTTNEYRDVADTERVVHVSPSDLERVVEVAHVPPRPVMATIRRTAFAHGKKRVPFDLGIGQVHKACRVALSKRRQNFTGQ